MDEVVIRSPSGVGTPTLLNDLSGIGGLVGNISRSARADAGLVEFVGRPLAAKVLFTSLLVSSSHMEFRFGGVLDGKFIRSYLIRGL